MHPIAAKNSRIMRRRGFYASPPLQVVRSVIHGQSIYFGVKNPIDVVQKHHLVGQFYEEEELAIIAKYFPVGGRFCDIGANVGNHSIFVAKFLSASAITLFELNPEAIEILECNIFLNGLETLCNRDHLGIGLSDHVSETASLRVPRKNLGAARIAGDEGDIPLRTGDALLSDAEFDLIKIDVEGHEMNVLAGLAGLIARNRPKMFIEVDKANYAAFDKWLTDNDYETLDTFQRYAANTNFLVAAMPPISEI